MKNLLFTLLLLASAGLSAQTADRNKASVAEFYKAFNGAPTQFDAARFFSKDVVDHAVPPEDWAHMGADGIERLQTMLLGYKMAFPNVHINVSLVVAEGDYVMAYGEASGTFTGEFMGQQPTGKSFRFMDSDVFQFDRDGKIIAHWSTQDGTVLLQQIGISLK